MTAFVAFCGVLGKLEEINLGNCGLGPSSAAELAKAVSNAGPGLVEVVLDQNFLTGANKWDCQPHIVGEYILRCTCGLVCIQML